MTDLLDALGAAKEGSLALNREIERAVNPDGPFPITTPAYSTSIDAALRLRPDGPWSIEIEIWTTRHGEKCASAELVNSMTGEGQTWEVWDSPHAAPLAVTIVCLRARAAHDSTEENGC